MSQEKAYLKQLNDIQQQAVLAKDGPVLVVAGPGSGKTRVLTYRIAHLIQEGVAPWEILALTFTNKAAREMKSRIERVVGDRANRVWAGTFHSIFARILRVEAEKIGYPANFTIYDTDDTSSLLRNIIKELNLSSDIYNVNAVRSRISSAKSNLIPPKLYEQNEELMQQDLLSKRPYIHKIYELYMGRCKRAGAMDFDDLLYRLYELLHRNPDGVREKYQQRFRYMLVDEFQDTNHLQYEIVRKLVDYPASPRNIMVVGDDAQSIYAFRGATIQNILDYEKDFQPHGIQVYKLEQNYRSTEHIVQAANEVITFNKRQIKKTIWADRGSGEPIGLIKAMSDNEEGKRVIDMIIEQKTRKHLSNKDIAILYRTNAQSRIFEEYLKRYRIPYKIFGGMSFYQRKEVKDMVAYFRLAINVRDEEALRRVINYPKRAIGKATVDKVAETASQMSITLWEAIPKVQGLSKRAHSNLLKFAALVQDFEQKAKTANAYDAAIYIAKSSGLITELQNDTTVEGVNRLENVNGLLDGIKEYVDGEDLGTGDTDERTLATYVQNIALLTDQDDGANSDDYITLMSVHAAKGLEFPSVFVVGLEEKLFPSFMSLDTPEGIDEERRLFYVAITRAETILTLSYAVSRYRYGNMRYNEPSRFLAEIQPKHLDFSNPSVVEADSSLHSSRLGSDAPSGAKVSGNFKRGMAAPQRLMADPKTFSPSPSTDIQAGMKVLHLKFGEGKVLSIDGGRDNRVATIHFKDVDNPQRRLMLKFAKLQILE